MTSTGFPSHKLLLALQSAVEEEPNTSEKIPGTLGPPFDADKVSTQGFSDVIMVESRTMMRTGLAWHPKSTIARNYRARRRQYQ